MKINLALRNVKKSFRDYAVYFITIAVAVALFYVFNAIEYSTRSLPLVDWQRMSMMSIKEIIGIISWVIVMVLAFLMLYANEYLLKRRSKEFGIYLLLGMENRSVSMIIFLETVIVGIIAFLVGILIGVITSQVVMVLIMRFFGVEGVSFQFVFSKEAIIWTFIYFFGIFILLLLWNLIRSHRFSLINLLRMERKNEKIVDVGGWGNLFIFILACGLLYYAYTLIYDSAFIPYDPRFSKSILFGYIGNLLFFRSLAGALKIFGKSNKKRYYKGLKMFTYRQLGSNIRTSYFSMAHIALLLLIALGSLITGNVINTGLNQMKKVELPYDMTLEIYGVETRDPDIEADIGKVLKENGLDLEHYTSGYNNYYVYYTGKSIEEEVPLLGELGKKSGGGRFMIMGTQQGKIISYSDYRRLQEALGETPIEIDDGEVLLLNNSSYMKELLDKNYDDMKATLFNKEYQIHKELGAMNISIDTLAMDNIIFVLPDKEVEGLSPYSLVLNMNYAEGYGKANFVSQGKDILGKIQEILFMKIPGDSFHGKGFSYQDKESQIQQMGDTSMMIIFVVSFLGLMFMIFSGAILAVQQLSRQTENRRRYQTLMILGADEKAMKRSMFLQHILYFLIPMGLAVVHSLAGVRALYMAFFILGGENFKIRASLTMTVAILGIYVIYMIMTYQSAKGILKEK